jgi:MoaA/NifB/PqqE/SkfB family radical SAM enzyme
VDNFISITPINQDPFLITWDLGRRCNYDCSYCPSHRHDNFSTHASLADLKETTNFLFDYISLIAEQRLNKDFNISFTGGEPTVNPRFIEISKFIKERYKKDYIDKFNLKLDLTTNGAINKKIADEITKIFNYVTVSYHAEADQKLKNQVKDRILQFKNSSIFLKVNVMFHSKKFDECKDLCIWLEENNIKFIPRLIGEDPNSPYSQAHLYSDEQKSWLRDFWKIEITPQHRPCCGGREFGVCSSSGIEKTKSINFREFNGWSCSVNWYFLHIEQQTKLIYHHQTCQATLDGRRGSIGSLGRWQNIIKDFENLLENKTMPLIVCPNKLCGCGLCTPKSEKRQDLLESLPSVVKDTSIFVNSY